MRRKTRVFERRMPGTASGIGFTSLLPGGMTSDATMTGACRLLRDNSPEPVNGWVFTRESGMACRPGDPLKA
ncbi:hypothetical protein [Methanoregula sp.]|uniref:hypothetical protein n=1 Tax=Methanoregula sp. TaxID=2052170 RepID=UPI00237447FD|nr:hypothetical protein [Methanoregula sp.]MDD1687929.1 hypothetical protein [Methanoregula sp.]